MKKASVAFVGLDVDGKTLGIAGLGRIGTNVACKAKGFDMKIIYSLLSPGPVPQRMHAGHSTFAPRADCRRDDPRTIVPVRLAGTEVSASFCTKLAVVS